MGQKKRKVFSSPRDVFEAYFPDYSRKKEAVQAEGYSSPRTDLAAKLAEEFAASLRNKASR